MKSKLHITFILMDNYVSKDAISKWQHNCKLKMYTSYLELFLEFYRLKLEYFWPLYILLNIFHSVTKYVTCLVRNTVHTHILHFKVNRRHQSSSWEVRFFRIFTSNFMLKEPVMVSAFSLLILFFSQKNCQQQLEVQEFS